MTTWRHARQSQDPIPECRDCWDERIEDSAGYRKVCTTPTPDPASPCKSCGIPAEWAMYGSECAQYVPTRCTCGHPIEATR